ncbi:RidA family protein [Chryseotalea sanaruensis]|uniref:RidA family protein n=2 Tax=Chryseotalea sanaruensis TaxID=2482724 RepID=A0A401UE59_9BACT|nr:RidA family protein [Chryseotalea sanaruensis]
MTNSMSKTNKRMLLWFIIALIIALIPWLAIAQSKPVEKQKFHFSEPGETKAGYIQAVKVGNTLYISGVPGVDPDMGISIKQVYDGLQKTLAHYGATFKNVVKENLYTTDIEAVKKNNEVRKAYYQGDFPAATWLQIDRLYMPQANLEVDLIAIIGE